MAFATRLGPWLLGTVKNTTGTTAGTINNLGATIVAQTDNLTAAQIVGLTGTIGAIPAGALITSVQFLTTTVFSAVTTLKLTIGGVDVAAASTITSAGTIAVAPAATFTPVQANVGATDALVSFTSTVVGGALTTGAVTVVIAYIMRGADGSQNQTTFQN
jgi:hypothetical protein